MVERFLLTLFIGMLVVIAYLILSRWQRRRATVVNQTMAAPSQARLLYFRSKTCGACIAQGHYLAQLDDLHQTLIESIDVEQQPELARQYNIMTLPTTILIDDSGSARHINPGLADPFKLTRQLEGLINTSITPSSSRPI